MTVQKVLSEVDQMQRGSFVLLFLSKESLRGFELTVMQQL